MDLRDLPLNDKTSFEPGNAHLQSVD